MQTSGSLTCLPLRIQERKGTRDLVLDSRPFSPARAFEAVPEATHPHCLWDITFRRIGLSGRSKKTVHGFVGMKV